MSENQYLVEMRQIYKSFGAVQALTDVDFEVKKAEIVGLVGDNAAGKSTLMKILSGALLPDKGEIYFEGKLSHIKNPRDCMNLGIEMVYQDLAVFDNLDVKNNIFIGRELSGGLIGRLMPFTLSENKMEEQAKEILNRLRINIGSMKTPVKNLAGGQRQAIAIGRVILFNAKLVIMDEPTSALAVKEVGKILDLVKNLKQQGISVVIISHRLDDIFKVADKVIVLKRGRRVGGINVKDSTQEEVISMIVGNENGAIV